MMYGVADTEFAARLRAAIERKRWTYNDLRDALWALNPEKPPPSLRAIGNWVNGRVDPRGVTGALEYVLGEKLTGEPEEIVPQNETERQLLAMADGLPPGEAVRLIGLLRKDQEQQARRTSA